MLAATLIAGALAYGTSIAFSYLKRPKKRTYTAVQGETKYGGDVDVEALYGTGKTKGQRTFYAKWGGGNKVNADVFVLSDGWCDGLEPYCFMYGEKKELLLVANIGGEAAHYRVNGYGGNISIRFYDGRPGQPVDMKLVNDTVALGSRWKITSTNAGKAYVIVERTYDSGLFEKGKPEFEFVMRGLREYDPRKDSTVSGGSGPQRINDRSTWVFTKNPAVHRLNYQLGLRAMISGRTLIGEGKTLGQIDLPTYFAAMNVCDTIKNGKKTYECGLWVTGADDHTEILKEFDDAMAGYGLNRRGLSGVIAGAPQLPVAAITAKDIDIGRSTEVQFKKSAFERYNHLSGQFLSIEDNWNPQSLKPIYVNADVTADGRNRQTSNDFLQVTDPDIAQYLLTIRYRQNRLGGSATIPVSRSLGLKVQEGEWVTYEEREWMISEWGCDENFDITLTLSETSADIYDDGDIEPGPIVVPPTPPVNPSIITTVSGFRIETGLIQGADGFEQPTVRFVWDAPDDPTITQVRFEYRINGKTQVYTDVSNEPESGLYETSKDVQSGVIYDARATITTVPDRFRTFTPWVTSLSATGYSSIRSSLTSIGSDVKSVFQELGQELTDLWQRLEEATTAFSLDGAVGQIDRQRIKAEIGAARAEIVTEKRVRATETEALAEALLGVSADVNGNFANGLVSFKAVSAPAGVDVRFAIMLRAGMDDALKESGFFIEIYTEGGVQKSRAAFNVDQFTITDGVNSFALFAIVNGVVKMLNAQISQAQIDNLVVGTSNIEPGAVTRFFSASGGANITIAVNHGLGSPTVKIEYKANITIVGEFGSVAATLSNVTDGGNIEVAGGSSPQIIFSSVLFTPPPDRASTTFRLVTQSQNSSVSGQTLFALVFKR
ncbi:phage tail protein [Agrobacterium vaccinii]|nr:phage tail protein [Agrobacterium vaccinii]UHS60621.1 phage tail protein [Agrobacterium vaccinii]